MPPDRKEAAEKLRQLVNSNFKNEIEVSVVTTFAYQRQIQVYRQ